MMRLVAMDTRKTMMKKCSGLMIVCLVSTFAFAHEGHKPLPTRGMEVNAETGKMVLTKSARATLDVQTAEVGPQKVTQSILAYGTLVSPWNRHAMVSSPLSGRIVNFW
jgi:cobalt-zinc-cadmium efflux system membrane fusion protein